MARAIHWRIPFVSLDNTPYQVNIYEEGYQGSVVILKGGAQPFVTEELDDPDAFLPIRTSSGYITVICESTSLVNEILPVNVHDRYVELVDVTPNANKVAWNGYIMPEEYSGDWNVTPFELSLPIASPIGACLDLKYNGFFKAVTIGDCLKKILNNQLKVNPTYIMTGKFPAQTASMLTAIFSDIMFAEVENDSLSPAYGSGQNVRIEEEYSTIGDILEAFCKLYGYVIHETPDALWFCSSDMGLDYYQTEINYTQNASYLQSESVVTLTDADLPMVTSALNSRSLLPGKSKVRVYCEAEEVGEMLSGDFEELEPIQASYCTNRPDVVSYDDGFHSYIRRNILGTQTFQYDIANNNMGWDSNMFEANMRTDQRSKYGANFLSYVRWKRPDIVYQDEYDKYKNVILLGDCRGGATPEDSVCVMISTSKSFSALNFTQNGLIIDMKAQGSKEYNDMQFKWGFNYYLKVRLRWGDYYFVPDPSSGQPGDPYTRGSWQRNPQTDTFRVRFYNPSGFDEEGAGSLNSITDMVSVPSQGDRRSRRMIVVPDATALDINGTLELEIFCWYPSSNEELKYLALSDISISNMGFSEEFLGDSTDHYLSDFRRQLSNSRGEEYEYKQDLNNLMVRYSPSGVLPPTLEQGSSADYYEQTILDRLASWYDRTIEQVIVTVQNENISPGQRIARGNDKYIVVSKAHNWRDGMVTLTMQKLYEQAQT